MNLEEIRRHWEETGAAFPVGAAVTPTSRDPYLGELERANMLDFLAPTAAALEIGCGDAFHSVHYARRVRTLHAVDLAASLAAMAHARVQAEGLANVDVSACSVLDIGRRFQGTTFDCVISQRCLINLPEWKHQQDAILQVHSLLNDGGLFLLTEGFHENLVRLNEVRTLFQLPPINVVGYNRNLLQGEFEPFMLKHFDVVEVRHYGMYVLLSRVYHPLVVRPESPAHDSKLNEAAMMLSRAVPAPDLAPYSYALFYALRKRSAPRPAR